MNLPIRGNREDFEREQSTPPTSTFLLQNNYLTQVFINGIRFCQLKFLEKFRLSNIIRGINIGFNPQGVCDSYKLSMILWSGIFQMLHGKGFVNTTVKNVRIRVHNRTQSKTVSVRSDRRRLRYSLCILNDLSLHIAISFESKTY